MKSERTLRRELRAHRIALYRLSVNDFDLDVSFYARRGALEANIKCLEWALDTSKVDRLMRPLDSIFSGDKRSTRAKAGIPSADRRQDTRRA